MQMLLKLRSDQTNSVSVDLHQQRLSGDGRVLSFGHTCGRLRSRKIKSRHTRILRHRRQSARPEVQRIKMDAWKPPFGRRATGGDGLLPMRDFRNRCASGGRRYLWKLNDSRIDARYEVCRIIDGSVDLSSSP